MCKKNNFIIEFADISIGFDLPSEIDIPKEFKKFLKEDEPEADIKYEIQLLEQPLPISGTPLGTYNGMQVYPTKEGTLRNFTPLTEKNGCQVACLLRKNRKNILYYPKSRWDFYSKELRLIHLIGIEEMLMQYQALLLHSSVVKLQKHTVLFSGPSGIGKSTQAKLWETYLGAEIVNGDRCVIRKKEGQLWGCGSPWSGTSGIYSKQQAPIKGIIILKQGNDNSIRKLGAEAFGALYSQCIINTWNREFVEKITGFLIELLDRCPVYELTCRPDKEAVELVYHTLFEGGNPDGTKDKCTD